MNYYCEKHKVFYSEGYHCLQCFTEVTSQRHEVKITYCENKDQAQALANFLWNEKMRHRKDICLIETDLDILEEKWDVKPSNVIAFVKP